jgi:hypothetical protein
MKELNPTDLEDFLEDISAVMSQEQIEFFKWLEVTCEYFKCSRSAALDLAIALSDCKLQDENDLSTRTEALCTQEKCGSVAHLNGCNKTGCPYGSNFWVL